MSKGVSKVSFSQALTKPNTTSIFVFSALVAVFLQQGTAMKNSEEDVFANPPKVLGFQPTVITQKDDLSKNVGCVITLKGKVSNTKIPNLLGVQVSSQRDHRGKNCYAIGILVEWKAQKTFEKNAASKASASVKSHKEYILYQDLKGKLADTIVIAPHRKKSSHSSAEFGEDSSKKN